jgi:hypothetical protein
MARAPLPKICGLTSRPFGRSLEQSSYPALCLSLFKFFER